MQTYRGNYPDDVAEVELAQVDFPDQAPPSTSGPDEQQLQMLAYDHWTSLLGDREFPAIARLNPANLPEFGPYSVVLDFTRGADNPTIRFIGERLAEECGCPTTITTPIGVPPRSVLSRFGDYYLQILANQAPIGFETEFINRFDRTSIYQGILLPFSSDNEAADFVLGVLNWKEAAEQNITDKLLFEVDQALEVGRQFTDPDFAQTTQRSGPADILDLSLVEQLIEQDRAAPAQAQEPPKAATREQPTARTPETKDAPPLRARLAKLFARTDEQKKTAPAQPRPPAHPAAPAAIQEDQPPVRPQPFDAALEDAAASALLPEVAAASAADLVLSDGVELNLGDLLALARQQAEVARGSEDRSRQTLYEAIGKAYDFSLAAVEDPRQFAKLVSEAGLTFQRRAPMTPVVKLVFGADYDKTRLTEYAAALTHARRIGLAPGTLGNYLCAVPGGLKGVVTEERRIKRPEQGKEPIRRDGPREEICEKLRLLDHAPLETVPSVGSEFTLLVARRLPDGQVVLLGEVADDIPLLEKAAKKLID